MNGQFNVGDVAILRNDPAITTCPAIKRAEGDEVVIVGSLRVWELTDGPFLGYLVWHPQARDFYCAPHELRRPKPPTTGEQAIRAMFDAPPQPLLVPEVA